MKTRIIAAAAILPVALAILLIFPVYILAITVAAISAAAAYELQGAVNTACPKTPSPRAAVYAMIAAAMIPFATYVSGIFGTALYSGVLVAFFILLSLVIIDFLLTQKPSRGTQKPSHGTQSGAAGIRPRQLLAMPFSALLIPLMLSSLVALRIAGFGLSPADANFGRTLVMLPIITVIMTDSGAYFTGVAIGKHKPLPAISPNKTIEGFIGGIITGILAMLAYGFILSAAVGYSVSYPALLLYGTAGALVSEFGDLAFSLIKRKCGIKDYGKLIPGHGGILDRFDSLIFTAPVMLFLVISVPAIN